MIAVLIFSLDRACQLDLLLRSLTRYASTLLSPVKVLWRASTPFYESGYEIAAQEHPNVIFQKQEDFQEDVTRWLERCQSHLCAFLTDDSLFYGPVGTLPVTVMEDPFVLTFSLRLGTNTVQCYPYGGEAQRLPLFISDEGFLDWEWATGCDGDFAYPFSLDAHVLRVSDVLRAIQGHSFHNPNTLEDVLARAAASFANERPLMASYPTSRLVGTPVNRVASTHTSNLYGQKHPLGVDELNARYLAGERIDLDALVVDPVAAHAEVELVMR